MDFPIPFAIKVLGSCLIKLLTLICMFVVLLGRARNMIVRRPERTGICVMWIELDGIFVVLKAYDMRGEMLLQATSPRGIP